MSKKFRKWKISFLNEHELDEMMNELYQKKYYNFQIDITNPIIFDVGALIGETVLFFKDAYPDARITAFEPSPRSFALLKKNVSQNKLSHVRLVNAAVSAKSGRMNFYISKSDVNPWGRGDSLNENRFNSKQNSEIVKVSTVRLSDYIKDTVDLLKLDIEGSETEVIKEIEPKLMQVKQIILEFHGTNHNPENNFSTIISLLKKNGFQTQVFLSRWQLPNIVVDWVVSLLSLIRREEYWLRIYAKQ